MALFAIIQLTVIAKIKKTKQKKKSISLIQIPTHQEIERNNNFKELEKKRKEKKNV